MPRWGSLRAHFPCPVLLADPVSPSRLGLFRVRLLTGFSFSASGKSLCDRPGQELRGFRLTGIIQKELEGIKGSSWATLVPFRALPQ